MKVAIAQVSPVWLDKEKTIEKIINCIDEASSNGSKLICFGETFLPGYPFWLSSTGGAEFNSKIQKEIYSHYLNESVDIQNGDLDLICEVVKKNKISIYLGIAEKDFDRGGKSIYCSLVFIDSSGLIRSNHRKLVPTYEERLVWGAGDGNGLAVHKLNEFTVGGLNCWENWMPLVRSTLYAQGEDIHVAVWPGNKSLTEKITGFVALESRSFVISASSVLFKKDIPKDIPHYDLIVQKSPEILANGGSCISKPDGTWLVEPVINSEKIIYAEIDSRVIREERQNFDPSGHYSRPDVTKLTVDQKRQKILHFE